MKLLILLTVAACLQVSARGFGQTVTFSLTNAPLEEVFKEIKQQTGYSFIYTREQLETSVPVTCRINNTDLRESLAICFRNQPLTYVIEEHYIIIQTRVAVPPLPLILPTIDISGRVIDENGEPLVGVTVMAKISGKAISTNEKGEFSIKGVNDDDILIITSVGYYKEEIQIKKQNSFLVRMRVMVGSLDETIIKGYYSTSKRLNTSSVGKITEKEILTQPVSNPLATLAGRVPGLLVSQTNGLPGSNFTVRIRGNNSIQNGNSPLYVIDGVPFLNDADVLTQRNSLNAASPFNTIDPLDIESIDILKDADATSIYGSRGANGVILITTKKGQSGKTSIDLNVRSGWGKVTRTMNYLNTTQYLEMRHEAFANDSRVPTSANAFDFLVWDTTRYTDFKNLLIGETAHTNNISLQVSGGSSNTKFSIGGNFYNETTVFPGTSGARRVGVNSSITHRSANNKLNINFQASYGSDKSNMLQADLTQYINLIPNTPPLYDSLGHLSFAKQGFGFNNPMINLLRTNRVVTDRLTASTLLQYQVLKSLKLKANIGYNEVYVDETNLIPIASQDPAFNPTGVSYFGANRIGSWIVEPQAEYNLAIGKKAKLQALLGSTIQKNASKSTSLSASGYTNDNLLNSTTGAQTIVAQNGYQLYKYAAIFSRLNFNWDEKYIINVTGRRDGSSRFGPGKQFTNFYAVGAAWVWSDEKFIKDKFSILNYGKLRLSYGTTGNDLIGNYQYLDTYSPTQYPYQGSPSLFPTKLFNSNYSWEEIAKFNVGLELGLLKNKILISADYFNNKSKNQIINYNLPGQTGFSSILRNFPGVVQNRGFEVELTTINIQNKNFKWTTSVNFTQTRNKLLSFPGLQNSSYASRYEIGRPLNAYIGSQYLSVDPVTGLYQFLDKDQHVTPSPSVNDYKYVGTTDPRFFGGFQNGLTYKKLEFSFLLEFRSQDGVHPVYNTTGATGNTVNQPVAVFNRWQKPGDYKSYERYSQTSGAARNAIIAIFNSSARLTDASFVRLKSMSLSYSFNSAKLTKKGINNICLFSEAQNLFVLTNYKGADPETQNTKALPPLSILTCGIQLNF